uniref:Integrase zinc-binding domain-containing protein n=1 Tax=Magallana gigas TaxID=29159 RepID=A0A8W8NUJ8_MAGGI
MLWKTEDTSKVLVLPGTTQLEVMALCHDVPAAGHPGVVRNMSRIKERFYCYSMTLDIQTYVISCASIMYRRSTIRQEKGEHFLDFVRMKTSLRSVVDPRTFVYDLGLLSDGTSHTAICENCSFDVILFRMSEQNSSSSDLIGLENFSLLGDDYLESLGSIHVQNF